MLRWLPAASAEALVEVRQKLGLPFQGTRIPGRVSRHIGALGQSYGSLIELNFKFAPWIPEFDRVPSALVSMFSLL